MFFSIFIHKLESCCFHTFEHILDPTEFLKAVCRIMHKDSKFICEVPSLFDPLLTLFESPSFNSFYFQLQHPYVYSHDSIERIMTTNGFETERIISHQRYGLENHLYWLDVDRSGGERKHKEISSSVCFQYRENLEKEKFTDSVIWIGRLNPITK